MMPTAAAKIRYLVSTNRRTLSALGTLLVVIGLIGVVVTMLFPPTIALAEVTDRSTVETTTNTTATVEGDHAMYDAGEVLHDEPVYIRDVAPNVTVAATTRAPADGVTVDQQVSIVYEASSRDDGVFRHREHVVSSTSGRIVEEGDTVESTVTLQIAEIADRLEAMSDEIGDAGQVTASLRVETSYESAGYDGTLEERAAVTVSQDAYRIPLITVTEDHETTSSNVVPVAEKVFQPTLPAIGPVVVPHVTPAFVLLSMVGIVVLGSERYGRTEFDADRERITIHRLRYSEWISGGELPAELSELPLVVPMESLEALVDVAIDSDSRVIHDDQQDCYAVLTGGVVYVFYPDSIGGFRFNHGERVDLD